MCVVEGQRKQEGRRATDFQVFANSQKLVKRGGKEKITPVLGLVLVSSMEEAGAASTERYSQ